VLWIQRLWTERSPPNTAPWSLRLTIQLCQECRPWMPNQKSKNIGLTILFWVFLAAVSASTRWLRSTSFTVFFPSHDTVWPHWCFVQCPAIAIDLVTFWQTGQWCLVGTEGFFRYKCVVRRKALFRRGVLFIWTGQWAQDKVGLDLPDSLFGTRVLWT